MSQPVWLAELCCVAPQHAGLSAALSSYVIFTKHLKMTSMRNMTLNFCVCSDLRRDVSVQRVYSRQRFGTGRECANTFRFRMDGSGILGNTAAPTYSRRCSGTGEGSFLSSAMLILVRSLHTTCRGSVGFENGNMFTNEFSLIRFSCERVLGLFSSPGRNGDSVCYP
jgi:hypothetical protein